MNISVGLLEQGIQNIFEQIGCSKEDAQIVAKVLVAAEKRNIPSHGLIRVKDYLNLWYNKRINVKPEIKIVRETPVSLTIDGDNGLGIVVANYAMKKTIEKASANFICMCTVSNSNHYGIAGYYAMQALEHDMIGISLTNANPTVAPTFSTEALLGTNPIAVAIPAFEEPPFVADFATTPIARGKVELFEKLNMELDYGFLQDKEGKPTKNPGALRDKGAILPLGSDYEHGSHKGYCLSAIVDIFSAVLSGANFGPFVPAQVAYISSDKPKVGKGLGHFFAAIKIEAFQDVDVFKKQMDTWIKTFRKARAIENKNVLIPGDIERIAEEKAIKNGIHINEEVITELSNYLSKYNLNNPFN